jgi:hypothetical protein
MKTFTLSTNKNLLFEFWLILIEDYEIPLKLKISFKIYNNGPNNTYAAQSLKSAMIYRILKKSFLINVFAQE